MLNGIARLSTEEDYLNSHWDAFSPPSSVSSTLATPVDASAEPDAKAELWDEAWPSSMPDDRTFRNTTPQLLLNWYLKTSSEAFIEQDTDRHLLLVNQDEETFWTKVVDFLLQR